MRAAPLPAQPTASVLAPSVTTLYRQADSLDALAFDLRATGQRERAAAANVEAHLIRTEARSLERRLRAYPTSARGLPRAYRADTRLRLGALGLMLVATVVAFIVTGAMA